ncbi:hypothetical protein HKX48_008549 [Thoreauomyces humboldtii]|nr:hypothetical protein HKX48_008549 [Thoreauomyces humboldtii]
MFACHAEVDRALTERQIANPASPVHEYFVYDQEHGFALRGDQDDAAIKAAQDLCFQQCLDFFVKHVGKQSSGL